MDARAAAQAYADEASEQASNEDESIASPIQQPGKQSSRPELREPTGGFINSNERSRFLTKQKREQLLR